MIVLNRSLIHLTFGLIWVVICITWSILFIYRFQEVYHLLNEDYISSGFQLLNVKYLESLRNYFYDNSMVTHLATTVYYQNNLLNIMTWIIGSLCISILYLYIGWQKNVIYKNGMLINGRILNWNRVIDFKWSDTYGKRLFEKCEYYNLILTLPKLKLLKLDNEIKIRVNYDDREVVNNILKEYTSK